MLRGHREFQVMLDDESFLDNRQGHSEKMFRESEFLAQCQLNAWKEKQDRNMPKVVAELNRLAEKFLS